NPGLIEWKAGGIYFTGQQKTASHLFRVDPATGKINRVSAPAELMGGSFSLARAGDQMAFGAGSPAAMNEVFVSEARRFSPRRLTNMTEQVRAWDLGTREVISWKSQDGTNI